MKVAAIDCGTNTIKLLVGDLHAGGDSRVDLREMRMVRLGEGVDATGRLADDALERTFAAIDEYAALIARHGVDRIRFCATSASRDAENAAEFGTGVRARLGVEPEVVSGEEEAALAFDGAIRNLAAQPSEPVLVVDIGGGSTELVLGTARGVTASVSMDIGSVRLHERHLHHDPPTAAQVADCVADIEGHLDRSPVSLDAVATVVGVAGTVTTVGAGVLDLAAYDRSLVDQAVLKVGDVHSLVERLLAMTRTARLELPWLHPGRADVIGAGVLILDRVLRRAPVRTLVVSEADILDGIAWSMV